MNVKRIFNYLLITVLTFMGGLGLAYAADYEFTVKLYDIPDSITLPNFMPQYEAGNAAITEITPGSMLKPGQDFAVGVHVTTNKASSEAFQIFMNYDDSVIEPYTNPTNNATYAAINLANSDVYPVSDDGWGTISAIWSNPAGTNFASVTSYRTTVGDLPQVAVMLGDYTGSQAVLPGTGVMYWLFFKVKADATPLTEFTFDFSDETYGTYNAKEVIPTLTPQTFKVYGDTTVDKTLSALSVSNGSTNYILDPTFVAGSETKEYSTIVPNAIDKVNISATPSDTKISAVTLTDEALTVGDNEKTITFTASDGNLVTYKITIKRLSNVATLDSLSVTGATLNEAFNASTLNYTATVPYTTDKVTVNATTTDPMVISSGTGDWSLTNTGTTLNTRNVVVKAEDCKYTDTQVPGNICTEETYKIDITRTAPSTDATLSKIEINDTALTGFTSSNTGPYTLDAVNNSTTSIKVVGTPSDSNASVVVSSNASSLAEGDNTITITVTAQDGTTTETYTLTVRRQLNDTSLASLTVTSTPQGTLSPAFSASEKSYTYTYDESVTTIDVAATAVSTKTVLGTGTFNVPGDTGTTLTVTAEDGSTDIYTITFARKLSNDSTLKSLTVSDSTTTYTLTPSFSASEKTYTVSVPHEVTSVNIAAAANSTNAKTVSGTGSVSLSSFDPITKEIVVTAEDNTSTTYKVTITRAKSNDADLTDLQISGTTISDTSTTPATVFNKDKLDYTIAAVSSTTSSLSITYTKSNPYAEVEILNNSLTAGADNTVTVRVKSQDSSVTKDYKIKVRRQSGDATLTGLTVTSTPQGTLSPAFSASEKTYTYTYDRTVSTINVAVTTNAANVVGAGVYNVPTQSSATITVTAEDSGVSEVYTINFVKALENDSSLKSLAVKNGDTSYTLTPTFASGTISYNVTVPTEVDKVTIEAEANGSYIQGITGTGTVDLNPGSNVKTVVVTAEDGTDTTYTLNITRTINTNASLTDLQVDGTQITGFNSSQTIYNITVGYDTTSVELTGIGVSGSTVTGNGTKNLTVGNNSYTITVTSQDGSNTLPYTVNIKRLSNNTDLTALSVSSTPASTLDPAFSSSNGGRQNYIIDMPADVTTITINATPATGATITNASDLVNISVAGKTEVKFTVVAEDTNYTKEYTLTLNKLAATNTYLSSLTISEGTLTPSFIKTTTSYTATVANNIASVDIAATAEDTNASVTGDIGNSLPLTYGPNTFEITVTAEDGSTTEKYTVVITREGLNDVTLKDLKVDGTQITGFVNNKTSYEITVPYGTTSIELAATPTIDTATATGDLGTLTLSGVGGSSETFNFTVTAPGGATEIYSVKVNIAKNNDTAISGLTVKGVAATWDSTNSQYVVNLDSSVVSVKPEDVVVATLPAGATISQKDAELTINPTPAVNTYGFTVKAEDGTEKPYTIVINRPASSDNSLKELKSSVGTLGPALNTDPSVTYTLTLPIGTTSFDITAVTNDSRATIVSGNTTYNNPQEGDQVLVKVKAENGDERTYTIDVAFAKSNDASLATLEVVDHTLTPSFISSTLGYGVDIATDITELTINATATNGKATIKYQVNSESPVTNNVLNIPATPTTGTIKVIVTPEDNSGDQTYTITYNKVKSNNNNLGSLTVDGYTINETINKDTLKYTVTVPSSVTSLTVNASAEDSKATLKMGTSSLTEVGSINVSDLNIGKTNVTIEITSESGMPKTYILEITKEGLTEIKSDTHNVTTDYIYSTKLGITGNDFKKEFTNDETELKLYKSDGVNLVTTEKIATGMILRLERGGNVLDEKVIVVLGDTNGDGEISMNDAVQIVSHYLAESPASSDVLTGAYYEAGNTNKDTDISMNDAVLIVSHYLEDASLF